MSAFNVQFSSRLKAIALPNDPAPFVFKELLDFCYSCSKRSDLRRGVHSQFKCCFGRSTRKKSAETAADDAINSNTAKSQREPSKDSRSPALPRVVRKNSPGPFSFRMQPVFGRGQRRVVTKGKAASCGVSQSFRFFTITKSGSLMLAYWT